MISYSFVAIFFLAITSTAYGANVKFVDCGSQGGKIQSLDVTPCVGAPSGCLLKKGSSPVITMKFTASEAVQNVTAKVWGIVAGIRTPFPFPHPQACKDSGLTCPMASGSKNTYAQSLLIENWFPSVRVTVEWQLVDQSNKIVTCFRMLAHVSP